MKIIYIGASAVLLAACSPTPPPLCDRASIEWDKHGTAEVPLECQPQAWHVPVAEERPDRDCPDCDRVGRPPVGHPPVSKPPKHEPPSTERVKGNNGLGNGDQRAPGRSLAHNRAENEVGNPGHRSGKPQRSN